MHICVKGSYVNMANRDNRDFFKWLEKSKSTEFDIIKCRKMQSMNLMESENTFGISSISVCGFINNDVVKLGGEIRQQYDEDKQTYYERVYKILIVCCELMDSVNEILVDEGSWSAGYFKERLRAWKEEKDRLV